MRLSSAQKTHLLHVAKEVYFSYLALDFFKNKACIVLDNSAYLPNSATLLNLAREVITYVYFPSQSVTIPLSIADKHWNLEVRASSESHYSLTLLNNNSISSAIIQAPYAYSDEEVGYLFVNKTFEIEVLSPDNLAVSLNLTSEHTLGGANKLDLYRPHLVTLFNMIQKIESEDNLSSLLVALATGSGKTFVQALWLAILSLANLNGVFAIPDKLMQQFRKDLNRLLPDSLTDRILMIRDSDPAAKVINILEQLQHPGMILIASSKLLLDQYYNRLMMASLDHTHLIFDEQHLLMANERRRGRLLVLSQQCLSVFLTATPNLETYAISGKKPVAIMSSGQKQKAGYGQFPQIISLHCELVSDLHRKKSVGYALSNYVKKAAESIALSFDHAIQPECSSAILTVFKELPYVMQRKENELSLRWRLQVPMASKMLCIVEDNETLVNCCHFLQTDINNENAGNIYHNGNFLNRGSVSEVFGIPDIGLTVLSEQLEQRHRDFIAQLTLEEKTILLPLLRKGLKAQLQANMFHYLVEYVLSDLSARNMIEHNQLRRQSEDTFKKLIVRQYELKDATYFYQKLCLEIDSGGAQTIAPLLAGISKQLGTVIRINQQISLLSFTNNWFLDDDIWSCMQHDFKSDFTNYANKYLIMGVMMGMAESETAILDSQPFLGLKEERYALYNDDGMQASRCKRRQRTSIELLNDSAEESSFSPNYDKGITKDIADNYLRLGFMGICISNMYTEGFSDANLHTIINVAEHTYDSNNSPISLIQGIGRARGLDATVLPFYIHALGHDETSGFNLSLLTKDDYYPELFQAQQQFKQTYITILGEQIGKDIIAWYHQHQEADESIDPDLLKRKVLQLVARALRRLNIQENHQIHLSRSQLTQAIAYAMKKLDKEIALTQRPYRLSLFIRVVGSLINFVCECYFTILRFKPWLALLWHAWTLDQNQDSQADEVYLKIIRQAHFKDLIAQGLVAAEFKAWIMRKTNSLKITVEKSALFYFKPEIRVQIDSILNSSVFPIFEKMVIPEKRAMLRDKLQKFDGFLYLLKENELLVKRLQEELSDAQFANLILSLLHQVPGLENLDITDVVNYPNQIKETINWFKHSPSEKLAEDPAFKAQTARIISEFIQNELSHYIGGFVTYPDKLKILAALQNNPQLIPVFSDYCIEQYITDPRFSEDASRLFTHFQRLFDITDTVLLPQKIEQTKEALELYQLEGITDIIQQELMPTMVNLYPLDARERLLAQITQDNIKHLLQTQTNAIQAVIATQEPAAIADFFFRSLCTQVPQQINLEQEKARSASFFIQQTQGWSGVGNKARYAMDYLSKRITGADFGLLSKRVQKLLISNEFLESISLLLPYHHWLMVKRRFSQEPDKLKQLADRLVTYIDQADALNPELLLQEINTTFATNYLSTPEYGSSIAVVLNELGTGKKTVCATVVQQARLLPIIRSYCLPILATYLHTDALKEQFLQKDFDAQFLCNFFVNHFEDFQTFAVLTQGQQMRFVHQCINQLYPNFIGFNDLKDPKQFAEEQANYCKTVLQKKVETAFLLSAACKSKLNIFLNDADAQIVQTTLSVQEYAEALAHLLPDDASEIDVDALLKHMRTNIPDLKNIYLLNERMQQFKTEMETVQNLQERALDNAKLADITMEQMKPILVHPQFLLLMNLVMGSLNARDLEIVFSAYAIPHAGEGLLRFKELIKNKDFTVFKQEFLQCAADQPYNYEQTPLKAVMDNFAVLAEEVMKCHCYYQQHNPKGVQTTYPTSPAFFASVSETVKAIRVPIFNDELSRFSRRVFFIQGVRNGLPLAGQVFSDSNTETVHTLQNIKNHLLSPLWWSVNTADFMFDCLMWVQNCWMQIIHALQELRIWILGDVEGNQSQSSVKAIEEDFTISAFTIAKTINQLTPLTREQIAERDCPKDVIAEVEQVVTKLPNYRIRLFELPRTEPVCSGFAATLNLGL